MICWSAFVYLFILTEACLILLIYFFNLGHILNIFYPSKQHYYERKSLHLYKLDPLKYPVLQCLSVRRVIKFQEFKFKNDKNENLRVFSKLHIVFFFLITKYFSKIRLHVNKMPMFCFICLWS